MEGNLRIKEGRRAKELEVVLTFSNYLVALSNILRAWPLGIISIADILFAGDTSRAGSFQTAGTNLLHLSTVSVPADTKELARAPTP